MIKNEEVKCELLVALQSLQHRDRFKIAQNLRKANELSYAEIKQIFGEKYNDGQLWQHLKNLSDAKIIANEKKLVINPNTGKVLISFYKLSDFGKIVMDDLLNIIEKWQNKK